RSGGAILDLLIHDIDFALHLFGDPVAISATGRVDGEVDIVSCRLFYESGLAVDIVGGWHPGRFPITMKYRVIGDAASVEFNFNEYPPRMHRGAVIENLPLEQVDGYAAELAYFADCVDSGREPVLCTPRDSERAVRLALAIVDARNRNGERV